MKFKENLRELRHKAGLTQADFANKMGIKQCNVSDYEIGRIEPNINRLVKFADFFNVSVDALIGRNDKNLDFDDDIIPADSEASYKVEDDIIGEEPDIKVDQYLAQVISLLDGLTEEQKRMVIADLRYHVETYIKGQH